MPRGEGVVAFRLWPPVAIGGPLLLGGIATAAWGDPFSLGGWRGPGPDAVGWVWTLLKGLVIAVVVIWFRVAWPRLREDQLQRLAWVWLVPAGRLSCTGRLSSRASATAIGMASASTDRPPGSPTGIG